MERLTGLPSSVSDINPLTGALMFDVKDPITSIDQIRDLIGEVYYTQDTKCIDHIDAHCRS